MVPLHALADLLQPHALHAADRVGEVTVHGGPVDANALKDLGGLVGLDSGDAHLGGNLHDPVEDGLVIVPDGHGGLLVQQSQFHQLLHALLGEIGVDGLGTVAQKGGEVVNVPGLRALQNHGDRCPLFGPNQVLLQGAHRQEGGNRHVILIHAPVRENDNVGALLIGPVHIHHQTVQGVGQRGPLVVQQGDGLHMEARAVHISNLHQVHGGEDGVLNLQHGAVGRLLLQQVAAGAYVNGGVSDDLFPDGVDGGICHLGEELLEVVEQGLVALTEHRQRRVHTHGRGGLHPIPGHGENGVLHLLIGVAEGLIQPVPQLLGMGLHPLVGNGEVPEVNQIGVQPLAVGLAAGIAGFELPVVHQPALPEVRQQHPPRLKAGLFHNALRRHIQHAHLRGENQPLIVCEIPPAGPKSVPVQHRPHGVAVREDDGGGPVPGLHHGGVIVVEIPLLPVHPLVLSPRLRDTEHDGLGQLHTIHHQKFQGVVQHSGVRPALVHNRQNLVHIVIHNGRGDGLLPGQHPVHIAPDGVDLPVVEDIPVGVSPLPGGGGIGGEPGVDQGDGALTVRVRQIGVELPQLPHQEHPLVNDGPAGERGDIGVDVGLFKYPPDNI